MEEVVVAGRWTVVVPSKLKPVTAGDCSLLSCGACFRGRLVEDGAVETVGASEEVELALELESTECGMIAAW